MTLAARVAELQALHDLHDEQLATLTVQGSATEAIKSALANDDLLCEVMIPFMTEVSTALNVLRTKLNEVIAYQGLVNAKLKVGTTPPAQITVGF